MRRLIFQTTEICRLCRRNKLKSSLRQIDATDILSIEPMSKLRDPGTIPLWSTVEIRNYCLAYQSIVTCFAR